MIIARSQIVEPSLSGYVQHCRGKEKPSSLSLAINLFNRCGFQCIHSRKATVCPNIWFCSHHLRMAKLFKAVKMLSHLSCCILRALIRQEKRHLHKTYPPSPSPNLSIQVSIFIWISYIYIFIEFYHPRSSMEPAKTELLCFCSGAAVSRVL